jgi:YHS domain-containing protein
MLWKEIGLGFLLAGFIALVPMKVFNALFATDAPGAVRVLENVLVGPLIAVFSFVCSVGNVPLAAVLWSGGISFAGVMAFLFADLIVLPIVLIYRKYYGTRFTVRIVGLMLVTMVLAALAVDGLFTLLGLVPTVRPDADAVFGSIDADYKLVLNVVATVVFAGLWGLTLRRGATDPICGMQVDRASALTLDIGGRISYYCSEHCRGADRRRATDTAGAGAPGFAGRGADMLER